MNSQELIVEAIRTRKPIEFEYNKPGKVMGKRIGNPHIVFSGVTADGISRTWVHIAQTNGVSDTLVTFPDWRMFIMEHIEAVEILLEEPDFALQNGYNPASDMYSNVIAKV